jgi:hypothetical protein
MCAGVFERPETQLERILPCRRGKLVEERLVGEGVGDTTE